ncbi:MAG: putative metal-binding motif-containing protein [Hyalangium sp.]|uniref:putative metal-binding motif-containing protein n=1 Tax=Hyalangium sp. TaxID=2028555 RepID=UPI00389B371F
MKGLILLPLALLFLGCGHPPGATEAAVHVQASYDFRAGCIVVEAHDKDAPAKAQSQRIVVKGRLPPAKVDIAVFRGADWGRTLAITVTAHEQKCDGPEVARATREYTLEKAGVETLEVALSATDADGDGYMAPSSGGTDCDDSDKESNPGITTEVCDGRDNDCRNGVDDGLTFSDYYLDEDGDGVGAGAPVHACAPSSHYVALSGDCDDKDPARFPGNPELCNGVDDNCAGGIDEPFTQKGQSCSNTGCPGTYVCNSAHTGTECNALPPTSYYPDADGDGEGALGSAPQNVCATDPVPAGKVTNHTDCDDLDAYNKSTGTELCDDRDNNCANGKTDEAAVCAGKGWKQLGSPTIPTSHGWNTVALGTGGLQVWIAGLSGALIYRGSSTGAFTDFNQKCGNINWNAAWVRPSDGSVFLAGDGGSLAMYTANAASCTSSSTASASNTPSSRPLQGIIGFESGGTTTLYVVNDEGAFYSWTPGDAPTLKFQRSSGDPYWDIHGVTPSTLLLAAGNSSSTADIHSYNVTTDSRASFTLSGVPSANNGTVQGLWAWDSTHAYAVGKKGLLLWWDGNATWYFFSPDPSMKVDLNSVSAPDAYSAYIASQDGKIRRPVVGGWVEHFTATGALKDIAASSRQDIWAVGNGIVVHFPE